MDLARARTAEPLRIVSVRAASTATTRRLQELGIRTGALVSIQRRTAGGGAILAIGDDRLALARALLAGIEVADAQAQAAISGGAAGPDRAGLGAGDPS